MPGRRDAWCYGVPGIARSLILAGQAVHDRDLTMKGLSSLAAMADRDARLWDVEGPTLCHGYAGVLQSAARNDATIAARAAGHVTAAFSQDHTYVFCHHTNGIKADRPGLLTGAAGTALALADYSDLPSPWASSQWDAVLLLS